MRYDIPNYPLPQAYWAQKRCLVGPGTGRHLTGWPRVRCLLVDVSLLGGVDETCAYTRLGVAREDMNDHR